MLKPTILSLALLLPITGIVGCQQSAQQKGPAAQAEQDLYRRVRTLVRQEAEDQANWNHRDAFKGSHLTQNIDSSVPRFLFPVRYSRERIFLLGKSAVDPLLKLVDDPQLSKNEREQAWNALVEFDDPRIGPKALEQLKSGTLEQLDAPLLLIFYYPLNLSNKSFDYDHIAGWLEKNQGKSYEQICLELFDDAMKPSNDIELDSIRNLVFGKWLNRLDGRDLDEWLKVRSPDALAFRNRALAAGYDPATTMERLTFDPSEEGAKALFSDPKDRSAMTELLQIVVGGFSRTWRTSLRDWYWQHREGLQYDWDKHRFQDMK